MNHADRIAAMTAQMNAKHKAFNPYAYGVGYTLRHTPSYATAFITQIGDYEIEMSMPKVTLRAVLFLRLLGVKISVSKKERG